MKKMNILLVVGACLLFAGNALAMELRSGAKVEDAAAAVMPTAEEEALAVLAAGLAAAAAAEATTAASTVASTAPVVTPAAPTAAPAAPWPPRSS